MELDTVDFEDEDIHLGSTRLTMVFSSGGYMAAWPMLSLAINLINNKPEYALHPIEDKGSIQESIQGIDLFATPVQESLSFFSLVEKVLFAVQFGSVITFLSPAGIIYHGLQCIKEAVLLTSSFLRSKEISYENLNKQEDFFLESVAYSSLSFFVILIGLSINFSPLSLLESIIVTVIAHALIFEFEYASDPILWAVSEGIEKKERLAAYASYFLWKNWGIANKDTNLPLNWNSEKDKVYTNAFPEEKFLYVFFVEFAGEFSRAYEEAQQAYAEKANQLFNTLPSDAKPFICGYHIPTITEIIDYVSTYREITQEEEEDLKEPYRRISSMLSFLQKAVDLSDNTERMIILLNKQPFSDYLKESLRTEDDDVMLEDATQIQSERCAEKYI